MPTVSELHRSRRCLQQLTRVGLSFLNLSESCNIVGKKGQSASSGAKLSVDYLVLLYFFEVVSLVLLDRLIGIFVNKLLYALQVICA